MKQGKVGRPSKGERKLYSVRIPVELVGKFEELSECTGRTKNELLSDVISAFIENPCEWDFFNTLINQEEKKVEASLLNMRKAMRSHRPGLEVKPLPTNLKEDTLGGFRNFLNFWLFKNKNNS
jgi:predicted DNA-binding protein